MSETYALSLGNDLPIRATITSEHGEDVTGLSPEYFFATAKGGDPIVGSDGTLAEDTGSSDTARVYTATVNADDVDALIELGLAALWLAIEIDDDLLVWRRIPVIRHRVIE